MDLGLVGKRILVGGGSAGLGAAIAEALAAEGSRVAIAARPSDRLTATAGQIGATAIPVDLSSSDGPAAAVLQAVETLGGLDGILVNSGGPPIGRFEEVDDGTWQKAIDGTLLGSIRLIRASLPYLREADQASILVILSSSAREPIPGLTTSNVLRPGLAGLIKSLSGEIAPIRINGIAPGRISTDRIAEFDAALAQRAGQPVQQIRDETIAKIPLGRYGEPAEVGRLGAFLLSPAASYVTGAIVPVDGGMVKGL